MFSTVALLPLVGKLGDYLRSAGEQAQRAAASGRAVPEVIAAALDDQMAGWKPTINGRQVLDAETRRACARFLAGVAVNVVVGRKE